MNVLFKAGRIWCTLGRRGRECVIITCQRTCLDNKLMRRRCEVCGDVLVKIEA